MTDKNFVALIDQFFSISTHGGELFHSCINAQTTGFDKGDVHN